MSTDKHHFRKVFKSDHLGIADLEDLVEEKKPLIFTIKEVKQQYGASVAGKKIDANIAYFVEPIKPMVLNATNSKQIKLFTGSSFVEDWNNVIVELYIDESVKMKGDVVGGVRIRPVQPTTKVLKDFGQANFEPAKKANATRDQIESMYNLTEEVWLEYQKYVTAQ
jgi:hypothetical protein